MRLWKNNPATPEGKYLVVRRDGTVPQWPFFVLAASDPCAGVAIRAYAVACEGMKMDPEYVSDLKRLADEFGKWRQNHGEGDPDGARHREDDPETIARMKEAFGS